MKSCDVREANTICAAAARMRGGGLRRVWLTEEVATSGIRVCVEGAWVGEMDGEVAACGMGGASALSSWASMSQQEARWRMWNVSI